MAPHSSVLAWRIPGTEEPGGLAAVYGVAQNQTRLKRLSSSSSRLGLAPEVRPPSGDCGFIPRGQTRQVQWGLCNPGGRDFRKEAGGGNPAPGRGGPPHDFSELLQPQGPPSFGCT